MIALKFPFLQREETVEIHKKKIRFSTNCCDSIITISNNTKKDLIEYVGLDKLKNKRIDTIYLGAEDLTYNQEIPKIDYLNKLVNSTGCSDLIKEKYFLYFGTIEPRKNVPILIKAFLELKKMNEFDECKLVIIGGKGWGNTYNSVSNFIKETYPIKKDSSIIHLDFISDNILSSFIKNSKAVVFPSSYEGFGLPVVESLRYETPCIVPNNSVFPELFGENKNVSIYNNFEDLVLKMKNVKEFVKTESEFSWQKNVKETYELYKNTVS
jgi:glycosyltransferase involved in cell wall biosynthesis